MRLDFKGDDKRQKYYFYFADFFVIYVLCYIFNWRLFESRVVMATTLSLGLGIGQIADTVSKVEEHIKEWKEKNNA